MIKHLGALFTILSCSFKGCTIIKLLDIMSQLTIKSQQMLIPLYNMKHLSIWRKKSNKEYLPIAKTKNLIRRTCRWIELLKIIKEQKMNHKHQKIKQSTWPITTARKTVKIHQTIFEQLPNLWADAKHYRQCQQAIKIKPEQNNMSQHLKTIYSTISFHG